LIFFYVFSAFFGGKFLQFLHPLAALPGDKPQKNTKGAQGAKRRPGTEVPLIFFYVFSAFFGGKFLQFLHPLAAPPESA
jgi:hypothetical protein